MLKTSHNQLHFSFPDVHPEAKLTIEFQRTLRIPDDGNQYPLPPGFGRFPIKLVDDFRDRVPEKWVEHGGVMVPMHQSEALWINFHPNSLYGRGISGYPMAVRIAAGKVNAVSGNDWTKKRKKGDYVVIPDQPWLDGFCVGDGQIRQFIAEPLGWGLSVEQQMTGKEEHGGIQIEVYPMKGDVFDACYPRRPPLRRGGAGGQSVMRSLGPVGTWSCVDGMGGDGPMITAHSLSADMGLGAGGLMTQEVVKNSYGEDCWVGRKKSERTFVHLANSFAWEVITRSAPPASPCTVEEYRRRGFPWYEHYQDKPVRKGKKLKNIKTVMELGFQKGIAVVPATQGTIPRNVVKTTHVRNGEW